MDPTLSVGGVIRDTFAILRRDGAILAALTALLLGLPQLLPWATAMLVPADPGLVGAAQGGSAILGFALNVAFYGAATHAALAAVEGRPGSFAASLGRGFRMVLGTLAVNIRSGLGILVASLLLVVPGVMLFCAWAVVLPAYVAEREGIGAAFARSRALTQGHRWRILGLALVYGLVALALFSPILFAVLLSRSSGARDLLAGLQNAALDAASLLAEVGFVALYAALRRIVDGEPAAALAEAFE